jgi:hypothetical protein
VEWILLNQVYGEKNVSGNHLRAREPKMGNVFKLLKIKD